MVLRPKNGPKNHLPKKISDPLFRIRHFRFFLLTTMLVLCFRVGPLSAWSGPGHRIIAYVASELLNPRARQEVQKILLGKTMVSVATWADLIRPKRPETAPYHYVNIPLEARDYSPERDNRHGPCIIAALENMQKTLENPGSTALDREEALKFMIHLVGDIHQPMHCVNHHDSGGNETFVTYLGRPMNLHHFWDFELVESAGLSQIQYVQSIKDLIARENVADRTRGTFTDWTLESHLEAAMEAYGIPISRVLDESYVRKNRLLVDKKLMLASLRLAKILNDLWPEK